MLLPVVPVWSEISPKSNSPMAARGLSEKLAASSSKTQACPIPIIILEMGQTFAVKRGRPGFIIGSLLIRRLILSQLPVHNLPGIEGHLHHADGRLAAALVLACGVGVGSTIGAAGKYLGVSVGPASSFSGLDEVVHASMENTSMDTTSNICFFMVGLYRKNGALSNGCEIGKYTK